LEGYTLRQQPFAALRGPSPLLRLASDERLIELTRRGQHAAFEALVARYQARLLAFCRHMLGSREDAEDVLQEVFAAAFNALLADSRPINARPWLYRIARNRSLNHLRRASAIGVDSMDVHFADAGQSTSEKAHKREEFRLLLDDIAHLPETQRSALILREMDALSYEQIAEAMETTVPSVKSLLVRARVGLAEAAESRRLSCDEVRLELGAAAEGLGSLAAPVRRHVRDCERCRTFRTQLRANNKALAAILPLGPLVLFKKAILLKLGLAKLGGAGGGAATAAGSGAAAATSGGAVATGGAVVTGSAVATGGGIAAGAVAIKAATVVAVAAFVTVTVTQHHAAPTHHSTPITAAASLVNPQRQFDTVTPQRAAHHARLTQLASVPSPAQLHFAHHQHPAMLADGASLVVPASTPVVIAPPSADSPAAPPPATQDISTTTAFTGSTGGATGATATQQVTTTTVFPVGATGATSSTGGTSTTGSTSATGATSSTGATSTTGSTSTTGATSTTGETGTTGLTGATGTTASTGSSGTTGETSSTGTTGSTLAGDATGPTGASG
jgi:RNA polymerase sigma factor (sigma-70 family)